MCKNWSTNRRQDLSFGKDHYSYKRKVIPLSVIRKPDMHAQCTLHAHKRFTVIEYISKQVPSTFFFSTLIQSFLFCNSISIYFKRIWWIIDIFICRPHINSVIFVLLACSVVVVVVMMLAVNGNCCCCYFIIYWFMGQKCWLCFIPQARFYIWNGNQCHILYGVPKSDNDAIGKTSIRTWHSISYEWLPNIQLHEYTIYVQMSIIFIESLSQWYLIQISPENIRESQIDNYKARIRIDTTCVHRAVVHSAFIFSAHGCFWALRTNAMFFHHEP